MTDHERSNLDDELLSAWHDGELSPAEHARIEKLIAGDPQRQRLLDDLRQLSAQLHALPRRELGEAFAAAVLHQAEREMLVPAQPRLAAASGRLRLPRGRRPWIWASAAIAAGLLLMLYGQTADRWQVAATKNTAPLPTSAPMLTAHVDAVSEGQAPATASAPAAAESSSALAPLPPPPQTRSSGGLAFGANRQSLGNTIVAQQLSELGYRAPLNEHLAQQAAAVEMLNEASPQDDSLWVIEVEVEAGKLAGDPFAKLLLDNSIHGSTVPQAQLANLQNNLQQTRRGLDAAAKRDSSEKEKAASEPGAGVDLVYVVASPGQLQQTLAQVQAQPATFKQVVVHPAAISDGLARDKEKEIVERAGLVDNRRDKPQAERPSPMLEKLAANHDQAWFGRLTFPPSSDLKQLGAYGGARKQSTPPAKNAHQSASALALPASPALLQRALFVFRIVEPAP